MTTGSIRGLFYSFDEFVFEHASLRLFRAGNEIGLPPLSGRLLRALVAHSPGTLSYEDIKREVWGGRHVSSTTIKQRVKLLRRSLDDSANAPRYIALVRGVGYRLIPPVDVSTDAVLPAVRAVAVPSSAVRRNRVLLLTGVTALLAFAVLTHRTPGSLQPDVSSRETGANIPTEARKLVEVGKFLYHRREPQDLEHARDHFIQAIAIAPDYAEPWVFMASLYRMKGLDGELSWAEAARKARLALAQAIKLQPDAVEARLRLAALEWTATGHTMVLEAAVEQALEREPANPFALSKKAYLLQLRGDWEAAMAAHEAAAAANPTSIAYQGNLSVYYLQRGKLAEGEDALLTLVDMHPGLHDELALQFARLRALQERPQEVLALAEQVQDETERLALEAMTQHLLGAAEQVRHRLERLRQRHSPMAIARLAEVRSFIDQDAQPETALYAIRARVKTDPSLMGEAWMAANDILNSPFIAWVDRRHDWSQLSKQSKMISFWAPAQNHPLTVNN